jgi:hypothetical protein
MSDAIVDLNPRPNGRKGDPRYRSCIVGGLFIECEVGRRWFEEITGEKLAANHSEDFSVVMALWDDLEKYGVDAHRVCLVDPCLNCHTDQPTNHAAWDFLVVTYIERGPFYHDGVGECDFVVDEERKPNPGVKEAKVRDQLKELFGVFRPVFSMISLLTSISFRDRFARLQEPLL